MPATARFRSGLLRETSTTRAPRFAASRAVTRPMPLDAPVITTTWSASGFSFTSIPRSLPPSSYPVGRAPQRAAEAGQREQLHVQLRRQVRTQEPQPRQLRLRVQPLQDV